MFSYYADIFLFIFMLLPPLRDARALYDDFTAAAAIATNSRRRAFIFAADKICFHFRSALRRFFIFFFFFFLRRASLLLFMLYYLPYMRECALCHAQYADVDVYFRRLFLLYMSHAYAFICFIYTHLMMLISSSSSLLDADMPFSASP